MRRAAGVMLGLSVVGCQGLQPMTRQQVVQVIPLSSLGGMVQPPPGSMPAQMPVGPGMLPPVHSQPQAGTVSNPQLPIYPQPIPPVPNPMPGEPPLAPVSPSTMGSMDPKLAMFLQSRAALEKAGLPAPGEDPVAKRMQMELTKEMVAQIVELRKKVQELTEAHAAVGHSKATSVSAVTPAEPMVEKPATPAQVSPVVKKSAPVMQIRHEAPAPKPVAEVPVTPPTPVAPPAPPAVVAPPAPPAPQKVEVRFVPPSPEELAARNLQMELTRELGRQVIDLKLKMSELRGDVETWVEASKDRRRQELDREVDGLRNQLSQLQAEMAKIRAPERSMEPTQLVIPSGLLVPPPEEIVPVAPTAPINRNRRPSVRENAPTTFKEPAKRFADALSEIREDLNALRASFLDGVVPPEDQLAVEASKFSE